MKNILAALCLCAAPLLAQATEPSCPAGNTDDYILGGVDGAHSAMHWPTGLVWKRCTEGLSLDGGSQCSGAVAPALWGWIKWNNEMGLLPKSFPARAQWGLTASGNHDLLTSGAWRLPYKDELVRFVQGCSTGGTPWGTWSASPGTNKVPMGNWYKDAWRVNSITAESSLGDPAGMLKVRLVRGGQPFAALSAPAVRGAAAGETVTFDAITLLPSDPSGQAWGGVRVTGDGGPQFLVNGTQPWRTEVIVRSGDRIAVRMTAGALGTVRTARLTVRSGKTADTASVPPGDNDEGGNEYTEMVETTADFILRAAIDGACGSPHGVVTLTPPPMDSNLCSAGTYGTYTGDAYGWAWKCNGSNGGSQASCSAPKGYTVTPSASGNGGISPTTPQVVAVNTRASFTVTPQAGHTAAVGGTCGGSLAGGTYTTNPITGACTVQASFAPASYAITTSASPASGGAVACTPGMVEHGQGATCTATPAAGYQFTGWTKGCTGSGACELANVDGPRGVTAQFGLAPAAPDACTAATVLHAAPDGSGDGSGWNQPAALQHALALANGDRDLGRCYEIRLRQGIYKPGPAGRPELHFAIDRPMQLKGGYTGNPAQPDERVLHAANTVLSGDIDGNDDVNAQGITGVALFSDYNHASLPGNQLHGLNSNQIVVIGGNVDEKNGNGIYTAEEGSARFTLLEGLTLTGGGQTKDFSFPGIESSGGGLLCNGAGIGRQCSPALRHLHFSGNYGWQGGGLYNNGQSRGKSSPVLEGVTFSGNWASSGGGAVYNDAASSGTSSPVITNATFSGNHASLNGGAAILSFPNGAGATVGHGTFSGNTLGDISHTTIYGRITMTASIVWGNTSKPFGGSGISVSHSIVQGGRTGTGNLDADPLLGPLQDNGGPTPTRLPAHASPAIDAVDCAAAPAADQRGVARPQRERCDRGAVEVPPLPVDGACGSAQGRASVIAPGADLCAAGQPGEVLAADGQYGWICAGLHGGQAQACSAPWAQAGEGGTRMALELTEQARSDGWVLLSSSVDPALPAPLPARARSTLLPLRLELGGGRTPQAEVVVRYSQPVPEGSVYLKYGPSPEGLDCTGAAACQAPHWYVLPGAQFAPDRMSVRLTLTDGGAGDSDGAIDSHIADPGLPVLLAAAPGGAQAIPTLGEWGVLLLSALAALLGLRRLKAKSLPST